MLTILCWPHPQCPPHLLVFKISFYLNWSRSKNLIWSDQIWKTQSLLPTVENSQNPQILRTISSGHNIIHTPAYFLSRGLLWHIIIAVSFPFGRKTTASYYAPGLRVIKNFIKLYNKTWLTKNDFYKKKIIIFLT